MLLVENNGFYGHLGPTFLHGVLPIFFSMTRPGCSWGAQTGNLCCKQISDAPDASKLLNMAIQIQSGPGKHQCKSANCENMEHIGTDLGRFGGDLGTLWGCFRDGFEKDLRKMLFE